MLGLYTIGDFILPNSITPPMMNIIVLSCLSLSTLALPTYAPYQPYVNGVHGEGYYHGPAAPLAHDGRVVDTPEVAHAKKAHLAAHAAEAAKTAHYGGGYGGGYYGGGDGGYYDGGFAGYKGIVAPAGGSHGYSGYHGKYHGPPAPLGHDGRVVDTPEVAHAKAAHLTAHAHELSKNPFNRVIAAMIGYFILFSAMSSAILAAPQWYGPHASPAPLGPDGRVVDTPEVAQLKAAHLSALAEANARAPKGPGPIGAYPGAYPQPSGYASGNYLSHYSGPPAPLGPDGRVVDTPEVQQAKAVHFSLYNAEARRVPTGPADPIAAGAYDPSWNNGVYNPAWDGPASNYY
ncbi:CUPP protein, partial [Acromyrmex heyeri]